MIAMSPAKSSVIQQLRDLIAAGENNANLGPRPTFSTGCPALDGMLPRRGLVQGSLVECLDERLGSGAETLALMLTRAVQRTNGVIVVMDRQRQFYPPAALAWKLPQQLVVIQPANAADELWAAVQALRNRAVAAVWLRRDRLTSFDFRRLRLAAEEGGSLGILFRSIRVRGQPTWADVQWFVQPQSMTWPGLETTATARRLRVELTRCRGGASGLMVDVELDDVHGGIQEVTHHETLRVSATSSLADSTAHGRSARIARSADLAAAP